MATVVWKAWDRFKFGDGKNPQTSGYGMILPGGGATLITGIGGRIGWVSSKGEVPTDAQTIVHPSSIHSEVKLAFATVQAVLS